MNEEIYLESIGLTKEQILKIVELRDEYNKEYRGKWKDNT